jgi:hypothetical protein
MKACSDSCNWAQFNESMNALLILKISGAILSAGGLGHKAMKANSSSTQHSDATAPDPEYPDNIIEENRAKRVNAAEWVFIIGGLLITVLSYTIEGENTQRVTIQNQIQSSNQMVRTIQQVDMARVSIAELENQRQEMERSFRYMQRLVTPLSSLTVTLSYEIPTNSPWAIELKKHIISRFGEVQSRLPESPQMMSNIVGYVDDYDHGPNDPSRSDRLPGIAYMFEQSKGLAVAEIDTKLLLDSRWSDSVAKSGFETFSMWHFVTERLVEPNVIVELNHRANSEYVTDPDIKARWTDGTKQTSKMLYFADSGKIMMLLSYIAAQSNFARSSAIRCIPDLADGRLRVWSDFPCPLETRQRICLRSIRLDFGKAGGVTITNFFEAPGTIPSGSVAPLIAADENWAGAAIPNETNLLSGIHL